jgi:hypothetical protein
MRHAPRSAASSIAVALLALAACDSGDYGPTRSGSGLQKVSGDDQVVAVQDTAAPLVVQVLDQNGDEAPGVAVTWTVTDGSGTLISVEDVTGAGGTASVSYVATSDTGLVTVTALIGIKVAVSFTLHVATPCAVGALTPRGPTEIAGATIDSTFPVGLLCSHAEFDVPLVMGSAYFLALTHRPDPSNGGGDGVDPVLSLWKSSIAGPIGPATADLLALSDHDGGDRNSEIFFVAPVSGTYRLVAGHRVPLLPGGYRVTGERCPVIAPAPIVGVQTYTLPAIPAGMCIRHYAPGATSQYRFVSVPTDSLELLTISVTSTDFTPVWQAFMDWDPRNVEWPGPIVGNDSTRTLTVYPDGRLTIAIGGTTPTASGDFTLTVTRTPFDPLVTTP